MADYDMPCSSKRVDRMNQSNYLVGRTRYFLLQFAMKYDHHADAINAKTHGDRDGLKCTKQTVRVIGDRCINNNMYPAVPTASTIISVRALVILSKKHSIECDKLIEGRVHTAKEGAKPRDIKI